MKRRLSGWEALAGALYGLPLGILLRLISELIAPDADAATVSPLCAGVGILLGMILVSYGVGVGRRN